MKKKVLYGFAMALIAGASMGTLQSCKDDLSDFQHQYAYDQAGLLKRVAELEASVKACKDNCAQEIEALKAAIKANAGDIANLDSELKTLAGKLADYVTLTQLETKLAEVKTNYESYTDQQIANAVAGINADIATLGTQVSGLSDSVNGLNETVSGLSGKVNDQETAIAAINSQLETYDLAIKKIQGDFVMLEAQVEGIAEEIGSINNDLVNLQGMIEEAFLAVEQANENMTMAINYLMNEIQEKFDALTNRMDNMITGIVLQATDSPVFGSLNTPLGIQSNILFNWYGYNDRPAFKFPSASNMQNYFDGNPAITEAELAALAPEYATVPEGYLGDVNLGKLYMTINPAGNFFNPEGFKLESSAANEFPATLTVAKSDDELTFGYSRATVEGNGFYAADVVVGEDQIDGARIEIDENLKAAMKDALNDPSKRTAVGLLKGVYSQINGKLPAYAVRYDWSAEGKSNTVLSKYEVAATTAKPLSYSFLYGKGTTKRLRTFGHIDNLILKLKEEGKLHFKFDPITFDDVAIQLPEINITPKDVVPGEDSKVTVNVGVIKVYEAGHVGDDNYLIGVTEDLSFDAEGVDSIVDDLAEKINESIKDITSQIKDWSDSANEDLTAQIQDALNPVADQINKMMDSINGQIDDMLTDLGNQFDPYFKRLNRVIDLYNKVAGKINNFLADPNHYLQVAMFYNQANSNIGLLSNKLADPTQFKRGNGNFCLYASSYTGEIVAPAYMKYVAVTNVYDAKTKKLADNSAAEAKSVNNTAKNFNTVMPAGTIRYAVPASALKSGLIYEIVYQGVDYSGRTSTQKFYIQVK